VSSSRSRRVRVSGCPAPGQRWRSRSPRLRCSRPSRAAANGSASSVTSRVVAGDAGEDRMGQGRAGLLDRHKSETVRPVTVLIKPTRRSHQHTTTDPQVVSSVRGVRAHTEHTDPAWRGDRAAHHAGTEPPTPTEKEAGQHGAAATGTITTVRHTANDHVH
jgi:hypothetical protein